MNDFFFKWQNRELKVEILEDIPEINLLTKKIGPHKKGDEIKVSYWIAKILYQEKVVKFLDSVEYEVEELLKIEWSEQAKSNIQEIDEEFYVKMKETLSNLLNDFRNKDNISINTQILQKKEKMQNLFKDIFTRRLYKILRIATKSSNQSQFINDFTGEEMVLYNQLRKIINKWMYEFV